MNKFQFRTGIIDKGKNLNKPFLLVKRNGIPEAFFICDDSGKMVKLERQLNILLTKNFQEYLDFNDLEDNTHISNYIVDLAKADNELFMHLAGLWSISRFDNIPKAILKVHA